MEPQVNNNLLMRSVWLPNKNLPQLNHLQCDIMTILGQTMYISITKLNVYAEYE